MRLPVAFAGLLGVCLTNPVFSLDSSLVWARATAPTAQTGAVYMTWSNPSANTVSIVSATMPLARTVELHRTVVSNGTMTMRQVPAFDITAASTRACVPGGDHIMLIGLTSPLVADQRFVMTLTLATGATRAVGVAVLPFDADTPTCPGCLP